MLIFIISKEVWIMSKPTHETRSVELSSLNLILDGVSVVEHLHVASTSNTILQEASLLELKSTFQRRMYVPY